MRCLTFVPLIADDNQVHDVTAKTVEEDGDATDHQCHWPTAVQYALLITLALQLLGTKYQNKHGADDQKTKHLQTTDKTQIV